MTNLMRALGVDPGGTTGIALVEVTSDSGPMRWSVESHQFPVEQAMIWLHEAIALGQADIDLVAVERYQVTSRTAKFSQQMSAPEIIGAVRAFSLINPTEFVLQSPADAKTVWTNKRLMAADILVKGDHARDATRHACLALLRRGIVIGQ